MPKNRFFAEKSLIFFDFFLLKSLFYLYLRKQNYYSLYSHN